MTPPPPLLARIWHDHSLTIMLVTFGMLFFGVALLHTRDHRGWDILLGLFHACTGVALLNFLAGPFRERNKPEE
jgi:Trk-type K+ transport system membrane component